MSRAGVIRRGTAKGNAPLRAPDAGAGERSQDLQSSEVPMSIRGRCGPLFLAVAVCAAASGAQAAQTVQHPFLGITHITRTETAPRNLRMHIVLVDLTVPRIRFELTGPGGSLETVRQTTLAFLHQKQAQVAINSHFFLPFPSLSPDAMLIGLAASNGNVFSGFEAPVQSYALVTNAPAVNIDPSNHAGIVHADTGFPDGKHVLENVTLWNALAGSAQIVTNGVKSIPVYIDADHPDGQLTPPGPANYSNNNSWYNLINARTSIGLTEDNRTLVLFTVDRAGGSLGMSVGEVADLLINDYGVYNALNLDGGGSTTMAMENPATHVRTIVNVSSDNPNGRSGGSNLAVFAALDTVAPTTTATVSPASNASGWNKTSVTVSLDAVDNPGGWVKQVRYSLAGAQAVDVQVVPGHSASAQITAEGTTTVSYSATDEAGNQETPKALAVRIDATPPLISGLPVRDCTLWPPNHRLVHVATVRAADGLSGVAAGSLQVTAISGEPTDPDDVVVTPDGAGGFEVQLRAERLGAGTGRTYLLSATATDLAGNAPNVTTE